ncbi:MAG: hypothetical protein ABSD56_08470 [Bryobacteraceae bacterium]
MPKTTKAEKVDLYKLHKSDYVTPREPVLVKIGAARYLTIDGQGAPSGAEFQAKIGALYGVAYTIKMTYKFGGKQDYKVCGLEGLWWCSDVKHWMSQPRESWQWKLMIRVPEFLVARDLCRRCQTPAERAQLQLGSLSGMPDEMRWKALYPLEQ